MSGIKKCREAEVMEQYRKTECKLTAEGGIFAVFATALLGYQVAAAIGMI